MLLLAQISDLHLDGTERATARAAKTVAYLRNLPQPVDALLVTGDIADTAAPAEYAEAAELLADFPAPVLWCPGNHDARPAYREFLLGEPPSAGPINEVHKIKDAVVLMCDSSVPGSDDGLLDDETTAWIETTLAQHGDAPAFLAFHHPPATMHHPLPDAYRLQRASELAELLSAYPSVVALITGHAHTAAAATFAGRPVLVGPAVTWTLRLPWEGDALADLDAPPGLAYHVLSDDGLTTHYRVVV
ncbi:metallophosphoesterase [Hamadaea sp. NPDC050747]|uniref:metallophosphoesterase n=1 Tax=Hamadaea sp. NPDC050747 TaxID=3155789 RepID=UPI0033FBBA63